MKLLPTAVFGDGSWLNNAPNFLHISSFEPESSMVAPELPPELPLAPFLRPVAR